MADRAEALHSATLHHRIALNRYSTGLVRKIVALLNRSDKAMVARLAEMDGAGKDTRRTEQMLAELRQMQADGWKVIRARMNTELEDLAEAEIDWNYGLVEKAADVLDVTLNDAPGLNQVVAAVKARPFQGRLLREWLSGAEDGAAARVRDAIRQGFVEGETVDQIVRRLRGTRAAQYKDGILEISRRGAEAMVRTAVTHTASVAAQETYKALGDLVVGVEWVATLDNRTTLLCASRDGKVYPVDSGPRPPAHINCRSTTIPRLDGMGPTPRTTYAEWLAKQSPKTQGEILGAKKAALFRTGGLKVEKFVDSAGEALTLAELRAKNDEAFEKAGLNLPIRPPRGEPQDAIALFLADPKAQDRLLGDLYAGNNRDLATNRARVEDIAKVEGWKAQTNDLLALRYYTGNGYGPINERTRTSGGTLEDRQFLSLASRGIDSLPDGGEPVWRMPTKRMDNADRWWERAIVGEDLDLGNQLQSFSQDAAQATMFGGNADLAFFVRKPSGGAYIDPLSLNQGEAEVLLRPGMRYRVVDKRNETVVDYKGAPRALRVVELEILP